MVSLMVHSEIKCSTVGSRGGKNLGQQRRCARHDGPRRQQVAAALQGKAFT